MGNLTVKESGEMVNIISPNVNNITSFKVHFSPKQEGTGDPSPENIREIVGWNGVEGYKCGKNIGHIVGYSAKAINEPYANRSLTNNYGTTINTTEPVSEVIITQANWDDSKDKHHYSNGYFGIIDDNLLFGQKYKVSFKVTNITNNPLNSNLSDIRIVPPRGSAYETYIDGNYIYGVINYLPLSSLPNRHGIEIHNCGMSFTMSDFMVTAVDNDDCTYEPFQGTTTSIDWTNNIGNIYGGYVDLITGEIWKSYDIASGLWKNWDTSGELDNYIRKRLVTPYKPVGGNASSTSLCNITGTYLWSNTTESTHFYVGNSGNTVYAILPKTLDENQEVQISYKLTEPVYVTTLSPTQLSTLKGQNNFWSNADYVEIEYELTETFDIQKAKRKIILNQPHVESTSGTIAKPETDMIGKIKECKIHFMPVQQGDSDPTPDNIVPITGWTGINVYQAFVEYPITPMAGTTTGYGVKWVVDKDGLMTAYGTPTAYTGANLGTIEVNGDETLYGTIAGSLNNITFNKPALFNSNNIGVAYTAGDGILQTGLDLSLYEDVKKIRIPLKRSGNVFMSGSCNVIIWKDKKPTVSTTTIDWTNVAGTMYGGYVDLISGELVQNYYCYQMTGQETFYNSRSDWVVSFIPAAGMQANPSMKGFCSHYPYGPYTKDKIGVMFNERTITFDQRIGDATYWKNFCTEQYNNGTPVTLAYELNTSITYQLTLQQLTTLRGINNIWSSANGEVEIKYWKH